jgi:hypothetical protein
MPTIETESETGLSPAWEETPTEYNRFNCNDCEECECVCAGPACPHYRSAPSSGYAYGERRMTVDYEGAVDIAMHAWFCGHPPVGAESFECQTCGRTCIGNPHYILGNSRVTLPMCMACFHDINTEWEVAWNSDAPDNDRAREMARVVSNDRDPITEDLDHMFCTRTCDVCGEETTVESSIIVTDAWGDNHIVCSDCSHGHAAAWVRHIVDGWGDMITTLDSIRARFRVGDTLEINDEGQNYHECTVCGRSVPRADGGFHAFTRHGDERFLCDGCLLLFTRCAACNALLPCSVLTTVGVHELCPDCAQRYFLCHGCNYVTHRDGLAGEDEGFCRQCYPKEMERTLRTYYQACAGALAFEEMAYTDDPEWTCACCGNVFLVEDDETFDTPDGDVCEECYSDSYFTCERCGDVYLNDDAVSVHAGRQEQVWCDDCASDRSFTCSDCGERFTTDERVCDDSGDVALCERCYEHNWTRCACCGNLVHFDDVHRDEDGDDDYCESCFNERDEPANERGRQRWIRGYEHTTATYFYDGGDGDADVDTSHGSRGRLYARGKTLYLSPEIEFDCRRDGDGDWDVVHAIVDRHPDRIIVGEDGSLNYGAEMKTEPMTLAAHAAFEWETIMRELVNAGWRGHNVEHPGLHVHLSRAAFDDEAHIAKFVLLFHRLWDQLTTFSRRRDFGYCKRYDDIHGEDTVYDVYQKVRNQNGDDRNLCVNLRRRDTVEVRLWKGTLNVQTFRATLEMCHLLFRISRDTNITDLHAYSWAQLREKAGEYPNLPAYLERRGL